MKYVWGISVKNTILYSIIILEGFILLTVVASYNVYVQATRESESRTSVFASENRELVSLNKQLIDRAEDTYKKNQELIKVNNELIEYNENLAKELKRVCPSCGIDRVN
jgi:hypothetical protein